MRQGDKFIYVSANFFMVKTTDSIPLPEVAKVFPFRVTEVGRRL